MTNDADGIVAAWREGVDRGEAQEPEELIRAHPEIADELRARFAVVRMLEGRAAPEAPSSLGEYRIVREIGRGGMGVVYEAEQTSMRRKVALKVLFPSITSTPEAVKRFCREAWAAGRVKHTNIVAVYQLGQEGGAWYCAMELVEGRPLSRVIEELRSERKSLRESRLARRARGAPTPSPLLAETATGTRAYYLRVAEMFAEVAEALQLAHDHGIVHRDVKPSNLLLDVEGRLKLVDFGLARLQDGSTAVTRTGDVVGTPLYMSPEQVTGQRDLDGRTDVYSLGATLYEAITLRPPFRGATVAALAAEVVRSDPPAPRRADAQIPRDLETIVLKALEKEPSRRYRTAGDMAHDLRAFLHGGVVRARRVGPLGRLARRVRRNKLRAALAAVALLAAGAAAFYAAGQARERERRADLEYERLCLEADQALGRETSWAETGRDGMPIANLAPGPSAAEILVVAILLRPDRPDAYFLRAIAPGRTRDERSADIDAARVRGLAERPWRLAKADLLADGGRTEEAEAEERLAAQAGPADASTLLAEGLLAKRRGDPKRALDRISDSLALTDSRVSVRCRALWWRSVLLEEVGDLDGAVADLHAIRIWTGDRILVAVKIASLRRRLGHEAAAAGLFAEAMEAACDVGTEETWRSLVWQCGDCQELAWAERAASAGLLRHAESARIHVARGAALSALGRHEEALDELDRALEIDPHSAQAHGHRGSALRELGRSQEALAECDRAVELDPKHATYRNNRGNVLHGLGRIEEALAAFDAAAALDPKDALFQMNRGAALGRLGRLKEALAACDRAVHLDAKLATAHINRGATLDKLGRKDEAIKAYERALELEPKSALAHRVRGDALWKLHRSGEALAEYDRALELAPNVAPAHQGRGVVLRELGRGVEALAELDRSVELDPTAAEAHGDRGAALQDLGRFGEALAALDLALGLDRRNGQAHENRGAALAALGRPDEALAAFDWALEIDPTRATAHANRGNLLRELGRSQEALAACDRAVELDANYSAAHYNRGVVLVQLGRLDDALAAFDRTLEIDPRMAAAHCNRGGLLHDHLHRPDEALSAFDRAIALAPKDPHSHHNRGLALMTLDRPRDALAALDRALELDPNYAAAHLDRARALLRLGRAEGALADVDRASNLDPTYGKSAFVRFWRGVALVAVGRFGEALVEFDRALEVEPRVPDTHRNRGVALEHLGRLGEALQAYERAAELGADPSLWNSLAWLRATHADPNVRDAARAVDFASRAVKLSPGEGAYWLTLGVALCRAGRWPEALEALDKSTTLRDGGDARDWLFAAIAKWHLGKKDDARALYDRAAAWADKHAPQDEELRRFRDEAAKLLGVKP